MKKLLVLLPFLFCSCIYAQLKFPYEKIQIEIGNSECVVTGIYQFTNPGFRKTSQVLYYPFVVNSELPFPHDFKIRNLKDSNNISAHVHGNGFYFEVEVDAQDSCIIEVVYEQYTPSEKMEYILTTTSRWNEPLTTAEYVVIVPQKFTLTEIHPAFENVSVTDDVTIYSVRKINYLPEKNFIIKWEERK